MEKVIPGGRENSLTQARFGGYAILEHLGRGGMGDVYKALQVGLDRTVALKILPSFLARNQEFSERFYSEAYAISRLQHQNIVTIYDYGEENDQKYIAMQYVQGSTLSQLIQEAKPLDYGRVITITKQICRGLKYAHQNDIVHRDIKSSNIMVEPGDKVYISDFGIAKVIDAPSITTTGMAMGTPEYMAPEQCEGGEVDGQSDIYGLGIILYEMLTGKPPFLAETPLAVAYKQVHETPAPISKKRPDAPPRLEMIAIKCLKKKKADRYQNVDELLKDLDSVGFALHAPARGSRPAPELPPDQRIADRRQADRRQGLARAGSRAREIAVWAGALGLVLGLGWALGAAFQTWRAKPAPMAMTWLSAPEAPSDARNLFDGDPATAWSPARNGRREAHLPVRFNGPVILVGAVVEAGAPTKGNAPALAIPRFVSLEVDGRTALRLPLLNTYQPQYLGFGGILGRQFTLIFENPAGGDAIGLRGIRFVGLPYGRE